MCKICHRIPCIEGCPNYEPPTYQFTCTECGEGILQGDRYLKNDDGEYIHYDCIMSVDHLLGWLGYDVQTYWSDDY